MKEMWRPSEERKASSNINEFLKFASAKEGLELSDFSSLYQWSVNDPSSFWDNARIFLGIDFTEPASEVIDSDGLIHRTRFFPGAKLNFAQQLLKRGKDNDEALVFRGEEQLRRTLSFAEVRARVATVQKLMEEQGVSKGDRVAGVVPNMPESIICMLAAASLGAIWSSCSPDFGVSGILDRFEQIEPSLLICSDGYFHKGKWYSLAEKMTAVQEKLGSTTPLLICAYDGEELRQSDEFPAHIDYCSLPKESELHFEQCDFNHPVYIMFSSGTTGKPKCIVHGAGGTLLEHRKELVLHTDLKQEDRIFYQTTCGWMMWNWLVSAISEGSTLLLYDGSPLQENGRVLLRLAEEEEVTIFGTNPKYLSALEKEGIKPGKEFNLSKIKSVLSTGSPLLPENFDYVYSSISKDLCLSSIAGGTDIIGCFTLGSPISPVYKGETQALSLGLKVEVFNDKGKAVVGEKGELVCSNPFPSMPVSFWNDEDGKRFSAAYFEKFDNCWHHGDYVELTERGTMIFFGRSDAVLNPGGIRIGTAEIYRQVETVPGVLDSVVVGQNWEDDLRVVLFVVLKEGLELNEELSKEIKVKIRKGASPFHTPKKIIQVKDIPRTRSGKITELAVREVIHGREVKNVEALANPEALDYFKDLAELSS